MPAKVNAFPLPTTAQAKNVSQSWKATHAADRPRRDGWLRHDGQSVEPMGYYTPEVLPFAYSLASTFTVANRWFSRSPAPTYPNRRFLLAGTAYGGTVTGPGHAARPPAAPRHDLRSPLRQSHQLVRLLHRHPDDRGDPARSSSSTPTTTRRSASSSTTVRRARCRPSASSIPASGSNPAIGRQRSLRCRSPSRSILEVLGANFDDAGPARPRRTPRTCTTARPGRTASSRRSCSPRSGPARCSSTPTTSTAATTTTSPAPARSRRTTSPQPSHRATLRAATTCTARASPPSSSLRTQSPGACTNEIHDHTSVLATIEAKWNLPALTLRDANAKHDHGLPRPDQTSLHRPSRHHGPTQTTRPVTTRAANRRAPHAWRLSVGLPLLFAADRWNPAIGNPPLGLVRWDESPRAGSCASPNPRPTRQRAGTRNCLRKPSRPSVSAGPSRATAPRP